MQVISVSTDEYLPVRQDSICLHPETMRVCGYTIAAPLMVRAATNDVKESNDCYVYCKAWPLPSLQLDSKDRSSCVSPTKEHCSLLVVVALGCDVALAVCGADGDDNGGRVKVCPLPSPTSSIPVARKLTLVSRCVHTHCRAHHNNQSHGSFHCLSNEVSSKDFFTRLL